VLFILDNYDSFTFNLAQYFGELGTEPMVVRNDRISPAEVVDLAPTAIVISPGPRTPAEAGISVALIRLAAEVGIPTLGVCLGHQAIGEAFGGRVIRASRQMHGKVTPINHDGGGLFSGLDAPLPVMRYHSLVIDPSALPAALEVTASSADREPGEEIMAVRHRTAPVWGVQFHPESVGTPAGRRLLTNFLDGLAARP
jgi:anthranilate synthase/aminodeoxychorismate synthase-like glutamine amidotransferase